MLWLLLFGLVLLLAYWELWICEGAHLGRRVVVWLYDLTASRYEGIKGFDPDWERQTLGRPVARRLGSLAGARLLDAGAGTGRLARALPTGLHYSHTLVALEASRRMLRQGRDLVPPGRALWVQGYADELPFPAESFDLVACLETLEFTPHPEGTLRELVRVLRPGGWLVVTNRIGREARLILGRTWRPEVFPCVLARVGLSEIEVLPWQVQYDLAWARKPYPT